MKEKIDFGSISCEVGCGNCCPKDCRHIDVENMTCKVHPKDDSIEEINKAWNEDNWGQGCNAKPITLFTCGYFCPPIVRVVEEELGIKIEEKISWSGVVYMKDFPEILDATRELRGFTND